MSSAVLRVTFKVPVPVKVAEPLTRLMTPAASGVNVDELPMVNVPPLAKLKLPYKFIFTLGIAMRLVPLIISTYQDILAAQRLRGYDITEMNFINRLVKGYVPLFIPLVLTMLRRTSDMDIAIESRGFGAPVTRTYLEDITPTGKDYIVLAGVIIVFTLVFIYIIFMGGLTFGLVGGLTIKVTPTAVP